MNRQPRLQNSRVGLRVQIETSSRTQKQRIENIEPNIARKFFFRWKSQNHMQNLSIMLGEIMDQYVTQITTEELKKKTKLKISFSSTEIGKSYAYYS